MQLITVWLDLLFRCISSVSFFYTELDHSHPSKGFFQQKVFLLHKGFDRLTVMNTAGYGRNRPFPLELTILLDANQIDVEHRFFGDSKPDSLVYDYLNFEQVTADLHRGLTNILRLSA